MENKIERSFNTAGPIVVTETQKRKMVKNLKQSFELLNTVMKLRLAYLKKMHPEKKEAELIMKIHTDIIKAREKE